MVVFDECGVDLPALRDDERLAEAHAALLCVLDNAAGISPDVLQEIQRIDDDITDRIGPGVEISTGDQEVVESD
jgi:hypothetical protein